MGYKKVITYTLVSEPGASLRATGFEIENVGKPLEGKNFGSALRRRRFSNNQEAKIRWSKKLNEKGEGKK